VQIAIVTDAWEPQVNGVVRTLKATKFELERRGHEVLVVSPDLYPSVPCPTYPEIRLAVAGPGSVGERLRRFAPDHVHLSTEGPLCLAARRWCIRRGWRFTTAFHTLFPDYFAARTGIGADWVWPYFRWFHEASHAVMVSTPSVRAMLRDHAIAHSVPWSRGVDLSLFAQDVAPPPLFAGLPRPIQLYVGRIAVEKNIEAFLTTRQFGTKVVVGEGPARAALAARFPEAVFTGSLSGDALAGAYAAADVFVFPSRTDTFGLVMIEALASGTPVAAFPVSGPVDIVTPSTGALDDDLDAAIAAALTKNRDDCALYGRTFSWEASVDQFLAALVDAVPPLARAA
jgi:glycosyltransferase involved in cell wall biosynthesis